MTNVEEMGTDCGPECVKCKSTLWVYAVQAEETDEYTYTYVKARCVCCAARDEFDSRLALDNVMDVREIHVAKAQYFVREAA